jgi:MoxR-like ATPase
MQFDEISEIQRTQGIVGRRRELRQALAALRSGRHLLIEGTVGVGKTILALGVTKHLGRPFVRVDGDERYTEQKLTGWFDPPLIMEKGYSQDAFLVGPLVNAMTSGGVLFINELNRMPEGVQNILLPAMDERRIEIPKIGTIEAREEFAIVATQNPLEFIATSALSEALRDRFEVVTLDYQNEDEEKAIVSQNVQTENQTLIDLVVKVVRATRVHPEIKRGASVRAAIGTLQLCLNLSGTLVEALHEAASMALPTRIEMKDDATKTAQEVIEEIVRVSLKNAQISGQELGQHSSAPGRDPPETMIGPLTEAVDPADRLRELLGLDSTASEAIGWAVAHNYSTVKVNITDPRLLEYAKRLALRTIVQRVIGLIGPARVPTRIVRTLHLPYEEGELDIEETTERILGDRGIGYQDLIVEKRLPKKIACSLILDSSLSMSGDKLAMAAACIAVLAQKMKSFEYAIVNFSDCATVLKNMQQNPRIRSLLEKMLDVTPRGYTNIEAGLKTGLAELNKSGSGRKLGIVITDGNYTVGGDPTRIASLYPKLHVIMVEDYDSKPSLCQEMASVGNGKFLKIKDFDDLPKTLHNLLRKVA